MKPVLLCLLLLCGSAFIKAQTKPLKVSDNQRFLVTADGKAIRRGNSFIGSTVKKRTAI
jgi:hypothetical protein